MPQRTDERMLRFMAARGFVPDEPNPQPLLRPIHKFIKRMHDEEGVGHKVTVYFYYGYSAKEIAGMPRAFDIRCDDAPRKYCMRVRGKNKVIIFFDDAVRTAIMGARIWKHKDAALKVEAGRILDGEQPYDDRNNPGHAPQVLLGGPHPGA